MSWRENLKELQASTPTLRWQDYLKITGGELTEEQSTELTTYFSQFAAHDPRKCFGCGKELNSIKQALGYGVAIQWGLAHGEGWCSGCRYPYRGMHYNVGPIGSMQNVFLPYHPSGLSLKSEESA